MNQLLVTQSIVCPQETDHVFDKLAVWDPHEPVWAHLGPHGPMCTHMDPLWAHMGPSGLIWAQYGPTWARGAPGGPIRAHMGPAWPMIAPVPITKQWREEVRPFLELRR